MMIDLKTAVAMRMRAETLATPLLFHDARTPCRQASRVRRIMSWLGESGRLLTTDFAIGRRKWDADAERSTIMFKRGGIA